MQNISSVCERLKISRINSKYRSAREFANKNDIAESTYAQHESGKRALTLKNLLLYSKKLNVNPAWLLTGEDPITIDDKTEKNSPIIQINNPVMYLILQEIISVMPNKKLNSSSVLVKLIEAIYLDYQQQNNIKVINEIMQKHLHNL